MRFWKRQVEHVHKIYIYIIYGVHPSRNNQTFCWFGTRAKAELLLTQCLGVWAQRSWQWLRSTNCIATRPPLPDDSIQNPLVSNPWLAIKIDSRHQSDTVIFLILSWVVSARSCLSCPLKWLKTKRKYSGRIKLILITHSLSFVYLLLYSKSRHMGIFIVSNKNVTTNRQDRSAQEVKQNKEKYKPDHT